jgi:multisubunit Na+/H+ antiporter MnhB subunit
MGFIAGLSITVCIVLFALLYLRRPLELILTNLCGNADRARFWTAFSNVTLFLVPIVFALNHQPDATDKQAAVFMISSQIECALIGLVISVVVLGFILSRYIPRANPIRPAKGNDVS